MNTEGGGRKTGLLGEVTEACQVTAGTEFILFVLLPKCERHCSITLHKESSKEVILCKKISILHMNQQLSFPSLHDLQVFQEGNAAIGEFHPFWHDQRLLGQATEEHLGPQVHGLIQQRGCNV